MEFKTLELRNEINPKTRKNMTSVYLLTLEFDAETFMKTCPCLTCGAVPERHEFKPFKGKIYNYCKRTHVTMSVSTWNPLDENSSLMPYMSIVSEEQMTKNGVLAYLKSNKIVPSPEIAVLLTI
jgi:hypothetical protein